MDTYTEHLCVPVKECMFVHEHNKNDSLVGHNLLVLHEACEAEVSPILCVGHFL